MKAHHPRHHRSAASATAWAPPAEMHDRILFWLCGILLSVAFITGGSSQQSGWGVMVAELLALVILLLLVAQNRWHERILAARWGLAVAGLVVAVPLLQLLPIPTGLWQWSAPRIALQHDLAAAGVTQISHHWSLAPAATKRGLLMLLPGAALFLAVQALPRRAWRGLLWWFVGLVVFSTVLAFVQTGVLQDSFINPFPQYAPALAGVFANRNHQACALAMALVLTLTFLLDARSRIKHGERVQYIVLACAMLTALFAAVLPLVGSRAGVIVAIVGAAAALLASGTWSPRQLHAQRWSRWLFACALVILAIGVYGAFAWMHQDAAIAGSRWQMAGTTARLAAASMPLGGGSGSFVRMFEQFTQGAMMHQGYINAAHNDYLQWWFAGGVLALVAMLTAATVLIVALVRLLRLPTSSRLRHVGLAAWLAVLVPLLHSTVDYPLRTPALMASFGMLAGIAVATGVRAKERRANVVGPSDPPTKANTSDTSSPAL